MLGGMRLQSHVVAVVVRRQMPLAHDAGCVAGRTKSLSDRERVTRVVLGEGRFRHPRPRVAIPTEYVPKLMSSRILSRQQCRPRWRALARDIRVCKTSSLRGQSIKMPCRHDVAAVTTQRRPALVVGKNQ